MIPLITHYRASEASGGGGNGWLMQGLIAAGSAGISAVTKGGPKRQYKYNLKLAQEQNKMNRENQDYLLRINQGLLDEQRAYDSPSASMQRYKDAGLNPHLIYDKGANSSAPIQVGNLPGVNMGSVDASYPDIAGGALSNFVATSQVQSQQQKIAESEASEALKIAQTEVVKANPMLDPSVAAAVRDMTERVSSAKATEAFYLQQAQPDGRNMIFRKIENQIAQMEAQLGLAGKDQAIRNQILQSKEFENALKQIQVNWMKDGEMTWEHVRQGGMMLMQMLMR